jgi:hypothetical protein
MENTAHLSDSLAPRRRGRKPADANERRIKVESALAELEASRTPFSMADVAERAGISRATLYRDSALRDLVGTLGDSPKNRPVSYRDFEKGKEERRSLRRTLKERDDTIAGLQREITKLERTVEAYAQLAADRPTQDVEAVRKEAYAEGFSQGIRTAMGQRGGGAAGARRPGMPMPPGASGGLAGVAAKLPKQAVQDARRNLARVLHPDLFVGEDPATAALATELLKQLNALSAGEDKLPVR